MPPALTPALAVAYVRELSADVRAVAVLDAAGAVLAGEEAVARAAAPLLAAGAELEHVTDRGVVCVARDDRHALVAACGRFALPGVVRSDLRAALGGLRGGPPAQPAAPAQEPPGGTLEAAAEAVISAAQRVMGPTCRGPKSSQIAGFSLKSTL
jgi:hypothetical protein